MAANSKDALVAALQEIALGRHDGGRPLAAENARQLARKVLTDNGIGWAEARKRKSALGRAAEAEAAE